MKEIKALQLKLPYNRTITALLRLLSATLLICIVFSLGACATASVPYGNGKSVAVGGNVTVAELTEGYAQEERDRVGAFKKKEKENYDRQYGNDLYFQDFSAVKERLNKEFEQWLYREMEAELKRVKAKWSKNATVPMLDETELILHGKVEYYNDILEDAQKNNTSFEELLKNPDHNFRLLDAEVVSLENRKQNGARLYFTGPFCEAFSNIQKPIVEKGARFQAVLSAHEKLVRKYYSLAQLRSMDNLLGLLDGYNDESMMFYFDGFNSYSEISTVGDVERQTLNQLEKQYGEIFVLLYRDGLRRQVVAPKQDTSIRFETDTSSGLPVKNQYPFLVAQKVMNEEVYRLIDAQGLSDQVLQFLVVNNADRNLDITRNCWDVKNITTFEQVTDVFDFEMNLYVLYQDESSLDYEAIRKLVVSMKDKVDDKSSLCVYFYQMDEQKKKVAIDLFRRQLTTEVFFRPQGRGLNLRGMFTSSADAECFRFLDVYGTTDWMMRFGRPPIDTNISAEEWFNKYKQKSLWEEQDAY